MSFSVTRNSGKGHQPVAQDGCRGDTCSDENDAETEKKPRNRLLLGRRASRCIGESQTGDRRAKRRWNFRHRPRWKKPEFFFLGRCLVLFSPLSFFLMTGIFLSRVSNFMTASGDDPEMGFKMAGSSLEGQYSLSCGRNSAVKATR